MNLFKTLASGTVIAGIALLFYIFVIPAEEQLLDSLVSTGPDIKSDDWIGAFRYWATLGIVAAVWAAAVWYALGQFAFNLNRWANADKRWWWLALFVFSLAAAVPASLLMPEAQEWGRLAWGFFFLNNFLVYYLTTLFCSPSSFKYTPYWAMHVRRFW